MKRRNFLSGLMAAPLALKARLAQFFVRKPVEGCGFALFGGPKVPEYYQPLPGVQVLAQRLSQGKSMEEAISRPIKIPLHIRQKLERRLGANRPYARCSLPRGHKGPHAVLFG